ncbi:MAG: glycosyltransferase family 2 protein, partial [Alphaproteobacteria bacterium]
TVSVLIPFYRDDPERLLAALGREAGLKGVEVIILDDGSKETLLTAATSRLVRDLGLPARLITLAQNEGRSKGRNRLAANARGRWLLFLDSDMLPDSPDFLAAWLNLAKTEGPTVAFGGFSLAQAPATRENALHRSMAERSDCLDAATRRLTPEKYVFTSNLLVRRDIFETEAFDEGFTGWGWEDVEWAMRVSRRYAINHIDNPATHLGLDRAPVMAAKYEQSAANFARVVAGHRDIVSTYPSYRAASVLKRVPLRGLWRPILKLTALADILPVSLRAFAMRLYRAALYAEAV